MKTIQPHQRRAIFAIMDNLGLDKEQLYMVVDAVTGSPSVSALSEQQANEVLAELRERQKAAGVQPKASKRKKAATKPGGVTPEQQDKIWAVLGELEKYDETPSEVSHRKRLCGIIRHELGVDAAPSKPFQWLDGKQGARLIDALVRYVASASRKASRRGRVADG